MVEECIYPVIVTPESTKMDSNSAENPPPPSSGTRRHSLSDKPDTTKRRVPIYLRASTGSCHDICKFGRHCGSEEETRESFRRRTWKSSPNLAYFMQVPVSDNKQKGSFSKEKMVMDSLKVRTLKSSPSEVKPIHKMVSGGKNQKKHSPRKGTLSGDKTRLQNLSLGKKSSNVPELPREILQPSEKVEVSVKEGSSSNDNKMSRGDKKTSDHSVKHSSLIRVKPLVPSGVLGKKMTSSESPSAARSSPRSYSRKTVPNKARESGRVKSSLSSTTSTKCQDGIAEFKGKPAEKDMLKPKARKGGRVKPSSPLSRHKSTEVKPDIEDSEKTLHVIKTEAENSIEENEGMMQNAVSIETGDIQTMEENHTHVGSPSSSSHEADNASVLEKTDKNHTQEIENSQLSDEIHNGSPSSSSHEEGDEEGIYLPSSSESSLQASSSSLASLEENDKQMKADDSVGTESVQPQKGKGMSRKTRLVHSEDRDSSPVKLNFRRGKIIDLQLENNVPKMLKFRRRRNKSVDFASDSPKGSSLNKTLRKAKSSVSDSKRHVDLKPGTPNRYLRKSSSVVCENNKYRSRRVEIQTDNNSPTGGVRSDLRKKDITKEIDKSEVTEGVSSKVVLKHQEMEMKQSNDGVLLNNVIEETASKLVESRISKVKALVGAFESVISLQETKPSSNSHG